MGFGRELYCVRLATKIFLRSESSNLSSLGHTAKKANVFLPRVLTSFSCVASEATDGFLLPTPAHGHAGRALHVAALFARQSAFLIVPARIET